MQGSGSYLAKPGCDIKLPPVHKFSFQSDLSPPLGPDGMIFSYYPF